MGIQLQCRCGRSLYLRDELSGSTIRCPQCRKTLQVPDEQSSHGFEDGAETMVSPGRRRQAAARPAATSFSIGRAFLLLIIVLPLVLVAFYYVLVYQASWSRRNRDIQNESYSSAAPMSSNYGFNTTVSDAPVTAVPGGLRPERVPIPQFSGLGSPVTRFPGGQTMYVVRALSGPSNPGGDMRMFVYLPAQASAPASLPCVLVAPAGTIFLTGNSLSDEYHAEALPYAEAGCVVVRYTLDGDVDDLDDPVQLDRGIRAFIAAEGGTVNGRNALEFVLQNLPQVNPRRIFVAGHSSAGTVALCMAATEPRLAGCIAYAACADPEARLREGLASFGLATGPIMQFLANVSPLKHADQIKCPVMVFHAMDDNNVRYSEASDYVATLQATGQDVHFVKAYTGGHYQSMIDEGIPAGIRWLQQH